MFFSLFSVMRSPLKSAFIDSGHEMGVACFVHQRLSTSTSTDCTSSIYSSYLLHIYISYVHPINAHNGWLRLRGFSPRTFPLFWFDEMSKSLNVQCNHKETQKWPVAWLESQHINYHSFPNIAPTTIPSSSSSLLTMRQRRFRASSNQSKTSFHNFATRQHLCPPHCDHDSCHCCVQYDWPRMQRQFSYFKKVSQQDSLQYMGVWYLLNLSGICTFKE